RHLPLRQGQALLIQGDCAKETQPAMARYYYQQALDLIGHGAPLLAVRCWQGLGDVAAGSAAADPAVAEAAYERAQTMFDSIRRTLHSHGHQAGFAMQKEALNRALLASLHQQVGQESKLLRWVERSKAAALVELLREQPVDETLDDKLRDLIEERERLAAQIDQRLHRMSVSAPSTATPQRGPQLVAHNRYQRGQIGELRRRLQWVEEQLQRARHPAQTWREGETLAAAQIQVQIGREGTLLAYYEAGDQLAAVVVQGQQITARLLNTTVDEVARQWQQTRRFVLRPQTPLEAVNARLGRLYDLLLRPLEDVLESSERLLILPHRILYQIPVAALYDTVTHRYALEQWICYYAPSATIWSWCQQRRTAVEAASLLVGYPGEPDQADYLPAVRGEIEAIAELVVQPRLLFGAEATAAQVLLSMRHKRLVHLAGHAFYDGERPLDSGMPLAEGRWLRAADLYLRYGMLDGALVVLSGCETGKGHAAGGEVLGLVSAFLYAGARTILSGLWKVDDVATAALMGRFYEELAADQGAAVALREAQLALLANRETAAPYFWAPFTINGAGS
ncbi:MAG: CHAT domain-containing protein, partial [Anaerolineales bacterium]|nr:CHAT domain-containing protein [Anaerolineales bacterium]